MSIKKLHAKITHHPKQAGIILLILTVIIFITVFIFVPAIPQWSDYHNFADARTLWKIPHHENVLSNLPFLLVSILGFYSLHKQWQHKNLTAKEAIVFLVIFSGVFLTSIGSAYYHWAPDNNSLVWDRLPITIVFMSLLSFTLMERVNINLGFWLLAPLLAFGMFSVLYWHWTELLGRGDLRLYGLVQFYTMLLVILIPIFFPKPYPPLSAYLWMFVFYGLSKVFEYYDVAIYSLNDQLMSGHTIKHIFAAISIYWIVVMVKRKQALFQR